MPGLPHTVIVVYYPARPHFFIFLLDLFRIRNPKHHERPWLVEVNLKPPAYARWNAADVTTRTRYSEPVQSWWQNRYRFPVILELCVFVNNFMVALVTGGSSGIGKMIASGLVSNGAKVYIAARKERQLKEVKSWSIYVATILTKTRSATQATDELNKAGPGSCHYIVADLSVCLAISAWSICWLVEIIRTKQAVTLSSLNSRSASQCYTYSWTTPEHLGVLLGIMFQNGKVGTAWWLWTSRAFFTVSFVLLYFLFYAPNAL